MSWPWPGDSNLDRARRVARNYRERLQEVAPDECAQLDRTHRDWGQRWMLPQRIYAQLDDVLDVDNAAEYCQVAVKTIYEWRRRGLPHVDTPEGSRYVVRDLVEYQRDRRLRRSGGAA